MTQHLSKRRLASLDRMTAFVEPDPDALVDETLRLVRSVAAASSAAIFVRDGDTLQQLAGRYVTDGANEFVRDAWRQQPDLRAGHAIHGVTGPYGSGVGIALFPLFSEATVIGLLYLAGMAPAASGPGPAGRLYILIKSVEQAVAKVLASSPGRHAEADETLSQFVANTSLADFERAKLLLILEKNEWNISRVARVTRHARRTIYLKLKEYNIPRLRPFQLRAVAAIGQRTGASSQRSPRAFLRAC